MAVQGSGLGKGPDGGAFKDQTSTNVARDGAAKRPQTSFDTKWGMKDMTSFSAGPKMPGTGPDASSPNPLDPQPKDKDAQSSFNASWNMKDANGQGVDKNIGGRVIGEAILSGSAKLPASETYSNAGPVRKP